MQAALSKHRRIRIGKTAALVRRRFSCSLPMVFLARCVDDTPAVLDVARFLRTARTEPRCCQLRGYREEAWLPVPALWSGDIGRNGIGKTTTMRLILGLDVPDSGTVTVAGLRYADPANPMREVGRRSTPCT